jgi:hypothetical protein
MKGGESDFLKKYYFYFWYKHIKIIKKHLKIILILFHVENILKNGLN